MEPLGAILKDRLATLYVSDESHALAFRLGLLVLDGLAILIFIVGSFLPDGTIPLAVDLVLGLLFLADYLARAYLAPGRWRHLLSPTSLADLIVIFSLLAAAFIENLGFLRVMRALRLLRSYHMLRELRGRSSFFKRNEEVIQSIINFVVFIFVVTALVYVLEAPHNPQIGNYADALYFTVTTLTTTGFGDIVPVGTSGRLLAVLVMIFGISLFIRLVQTIFRPAKVRYACPDCGLARHDPDAVHCKHCGLVLNIPNEGE